jgi:DNA-binding CsgD family transcriptional regulator
MATEEAVNDVMGLISAAAFDSGTWAAALLGVMEVTHSTAAQLVGWQDETIPGQLMVNFDPDLLSLWMELGGHTYANPMMRAGEALKMMTSLCEQDVMSEDYRRHSALWQDFHEVHHIPHMRFGKVWSEGDGHLVLAAMQDRRRGPMSTLDQAVFQTLLQAVNGAASVARTVGRSRAHLITGSFDMMAGAVFVMDHFGHVLGASAAAEAFLSTSKTMRVAARRIHLSDIAAMDRLQGAIAMLNRPYGLAAPVHGVSIRVGDKASRAVCLKIMRAPAVGYRLPMDACLVAVLDTVELAGGLTPTEQDVLQALRAGARLRDIALQRGVSLETIRTQAKSIYGKLGVSGRIELMTLQGSGSRTAR